MNHHSEGKWDFKRTAFKTNIPVGRVSPITPAETDRAAAATDSMQKAIKDGQKVSPLTQHDFSIEDSARYLVNLVAIVLVYNVSYSMYVADRY